jgi:putative glycosyltransferase (TIGR04372 family)
MKQIAKYLLQLPAFVVLIILRILRPLIKIELCIVAFHRYGHLALEPEIFLGERELLAREGGQRRLPIRVQWWSFGPTRLQTNRFLATKWKKVVCALPSWWIDALHTTGESMQFLQLDEPKMSIRGSFNSLDQTEAHLRLTKVELNRGSEELRELGVDPERPYVCLVVRDGGHYASLGEKESNGYSFMNFDIATFERAALSLVERGYQVVRMGAGSEKPFGVNLPGIVDYANSPNRSEFLDVFIAATCSFAVSTQTGPDAVCLTFRRPVCYIDVTRFSQFFLGTKLAWWNPTELWQGEKRLTLNNLLSSEIFWIKDPNDFIKFGVSQVRSDAEKINQLVEGFINSFEDDLMQSSSENAVTQSVQQLIEDRTGSRGREQFGRIAAVINPAFARQSGDWYLV